MDWVADKGISEKCPPSLWLRRRLEDGQVVKYWKRLIYLFPIFLGFWFPSAEVHGRPVELTLLHSNNITGYLFPCPT